MELKQAMKELDATFGTGFSDKHPELVIEYLKAYGLNNLEHQLKPVIDHLTQYLNKDLDLGKKLDDLTHAINGLKFD